MIYLCTAGVSNKICLMTARGGGDGVVGTGPRRRTTRLPIRLHDADNGSVGTSNHQKGTDDDDEAAPEYHEHPCNRAAPVLAPVPVVIQPHASHGLEAHESAQ